MEKNKEKSESGPINVVADAAVVIVIEKLWKLRSIEEVCLSLKQKVDDVNLKLQMVYWFLKDECWRESHPEWTDRLLHTLYKAEEGIDIFLYRMVQQKQEATKIVPDVLITLTWKYLLYRQMINFNNKVDGLLEDQHLDLQDTVSFTNPREGCMSQPKNPVSQCQYYERWQRVNADREDLAGISVCRGQEYENVTKRLLKGSTDLYGTGICGDEGSGKTYLAGRVFNKTKIRNHFECRAWVHVSSGLTLKDIRYEVLKQVKASDRVLKNREHMEPGEVKQALQQELGDKRYLIVLDDLDDTDIWHEFIRYLPDWSNGSRVLVTTRNPLTAYLADYQIPITLKNLGEDESEQLLKEKVNPVIPSLQDKSQIFQASKGLPLAIGLLGGLLLDSTRKKQPLKIEKENLPKILARSYNDLPPEEKPCFLFLTLFPKAAPIPVRRILQLWLGEGLLTGLDMSSPEDQGVKYLEDLIIRNLVEVVSWKPDGTPGTCQVATSMHDMFRPKAVEIGLLHIHNQKERDSARSQMEQFGFKGRQFKVRWLAEYSNIKSLSQSETYLIQPMRSFISFYTRKGILTKDLGTFLRTLTSHNNFRLLRVLDLEGVYKPYLQDTIGRLLLLKYLGLRSTVLDTLPNRVGNLPELETLDIKNTNITNLPNSLWKSGCLRHLFLNGFHVDPSILKRSSRFLSNLQTLSGLYMGNINESLVSGLTEYVTSLTKLEIFYQSSDKPDNISQWVSKLTNLHSLKLGVMGKDNALSLPNDIYLREHHHLLNLYLLGKLPKLEENQLPSCLRVLTLSKSALSTDPMHSLGQLQHLRTLSLLANSCTGEKMCCFKKGFPNLRVLKLWSLTELQELIVQQDCMASLKELEIRECAKLKFEGIIGLENLTSLEELILTKMPKKFVPDERDSKLREECCVFEIDTYKPPNTQHQEQIKEGKGEGQESKEGKNDDRTTAVPQGSQKLPHHNEDLPLSLSQQKISNNEEEHVTVPTAAPTGRGSNPFGL